MGDRTPWRNRTPAGPGWLTEDREAYILCGSQDFIQNRPLDNIRAICDGDRRDTTA